MCACGLFASSFYELALGSVLIRNGTLLFTVYCAKIIRQVNDVQQT
jgi:hypothetical protein